MEFEFNVVVLELFLGNQFFEKVELPFFFEQSHEERMSYLWKDYVKEYLLREMLKDSEEKPRMTSGNLGKT